MAVPDGAEIRPCGAFEVVWKDFVLHANWAALGAISCEEQSLGAIQQP